MADPFAANATIKSCGSVKLAKATSSPMPPKDLAKTTTPTINSINDFFAVRLGNYFLGRLEILDSIFKIPHLDS